MSVVALLTGLVVVGALTMLFWGEDSIDEPVINRQTNTSQNTSPEDNSDDEMYSCTTDDECITVNKGCCGCGSGGAVTSINRAFETYWASEELAGCSAVKCAAFISKDISCFSEPRCINSRCTLVEPERG